MENELTPSLTPKQRFAKNAERNRIRREALEEAAVHLEGFGYFLFAGQIRDLKTKKPHHS